MNIGQYDIRETQYEITFKKGTRTLTGYQIFIQMEYLDSFRDYMQANRLSKKQILEFGIDICTALEICMEKNIIHRDIKPSNIMVHKVGDIYHYKLTDFGVGRYLDRGLAKSFVGTDYYMAPEMGPFGKKYDITVDYYSLGLIFYQLLNNNMLPFFSDDTNIQEAIRKRNEGKMFPEPENDWPEMFGIIQKCCAFQPKERYQTATEIKSDLEKLQKKILLIQKPLKLHNPVIEYNDEYEKECVTWDCIFYNTCPQTVLNISSELLAELSEAEWNEKEETYIHGEKYKKLTDADGDVFFFKYEPILWRVLKVEADRILLLSDSVIYQGTYEEIMPDDKYFLLSQEELENPEYGFKSDIELADEARRGRYTDFVRISEPDSFDSWWIKSEDIKTAQQIIPGGKCSGYGIEKEGKAGIRPAMYLHLKQMENESYAGTKTIKRRVW